MKLAFIDVLGLPFDGDTLSKKGLGGSESAMILMAKELSKIGFDVTVFNDCESDDCAPGIYDGVTYIPVRTINSVEHNFDTVIVSRTVAPFVDHNMSYNFKSSSGHYPLFENIIKSTPYKVLWLHDTFIDGDDLIEDLLLKGSIDEVFTLTDWHTAYITNCDHGRRRNFDIIKKHIFQTRNGIVRYKDFVDVKKKDRNLFVYNASVTKGMIPLVNKVWPEVKARIPDAKLKIIGGFYRFKDNKPDEQEFKWHDLVANNPDIEFTGIISQKEISDILAEASFMIYPCAFPETFGISTLEALAHNVPLITCDFGALEETAIDKACYKISYPVEKNWSLPWLDEDQQVQYFVDETVNAYNNTYLHQQKMYACNDVLDVCTWDAVALQWKQHITTMLGEYLPVDEYRKVSKINQKVREVFGRRFSNKEENIYYKENEKRIVVVTTCYNAQEWIGRCIDSICTQDYNNYMLYVVNDASTDNTQKEIERAKCKYPDHIYTIENTDNVGAIKNQVDLINTYTNPDDIVVIIDGDDFLVNDPNIFNKINSWHNEGYDFTYGSCWSMVDGIPLISQPYPPEVIENKSFRDYKFSWGMPYTHLRTFRASLAHDIPVEDFMDENGNWYRAGGDNALFYGTIERANKIKCVSDILYLYNDVNPLNDYKVNGEEQTRNAEKITSKKEPMTKKKILIAIPTARYIEPDTFKSIYDLIIPEGCEADFQYFYGYRVDQVRNLIADWTVKHYDYLFAVDHDITFPANTLVKLLSHGQPIVTGMYRQRLPEQSLEIFRHDGTRMPLEEVNQQSNYGIDLVSIGGCGFGCVLVDKQVFVDVGYPQFEYHVALDHAHTISEDSDFCRKAREKNYPIYLDSSIMCGHIGSSTFNIEPVVPQKSRLEELRDTDLLPQTHTDFLERLARDCGLDFKTIYDIGACVLHWTNKAKLFWPRAQYVAFEGMEDVLPMYKEEHAKNGLIGLSGCILSDEDGREVNWYENTTHPGGNSYYKENTEFSEKANELFPVGKPRETVTLDTLVDRFNLPVPELIKIDVQGAELDVLRGATKTLKSCNYIILEAQKVDYNIGGSKLTDIADYLYLIGFDLVVEDFSKNAFDGDCFFAKREISELIKTRLHQ